MGLGIQTPLDQITGSTGAISQLLIGEKDEFKGTDLDDASAGGDFYNLQPGTSAITIAAAGNLIDTNFFTGSAARTPGLPGRLNVQGGFVVGASGDAAVLILRNLMQSLDPGYHLLGGSGTTLPAAVDVVASQTLRTTAAITPADGLGATRNPVRLNIAPATGTASTVDVVDGQNLSGTGNKTIADDLTGTTPAELDVILTVTPDGSAALSDPAIPGTIVIVGTDFAGDSQTVTLSFATGALTTAQETDQRFASVTQVTTTGWSAGTFDIEGDIEAVPRIETGKDFGKIEVKGTDHTGENIEETLIFTDSNVADDQDSDLYYATVTEVTTENFIEGDFAITAQDKAVRITLSQFDDRPVCFWDGEAAVGLVPQAFFDALIQQLTLAISPDAALAYDLAVIGRDMKHYTNLAGDTGATARKTDASALDFATEDIFSGWQAAISVSGVSAALTDANLVVNQNYSPSAVISGERTNEAAPIRQGRREITLTGNILYSVENNLQDFFINNYKFNNIDIILSNKNIGAFPWRQIWRIRRGQLETLPAVTAEDDSEVTQAITIRGLPGRGGQGADLEIFLEVSEYTPLRVYTA